jgi:membrane protease subunit HflK
MYLDTMQQIFSSTSKVMVDAKSGSNLLYLPLDKLIAQTAANDAAPAAPVPVRCRCRRSSPTPTQEVMQTIEQVRQRDSRSRDSSRDRESR